MNVSSTGSTRTGALAGQNFGTVTNVQVLGGTITSTHANEHVGGLVGSNAATGTINGNSSVTATVTGATRKLRGRRRRIELWHDHERELRWHGHHKHRQYAARRHCRHQLRRLPERMSRARRSTATHSPAARPVALPVTTKSAELSPPRPPAPACWSGRAALAAALRASTPARSAPTRRRPAP